MTDTGYDYGEESEKLGGVPGVLRLKDGGEVTVIVTGPMKECLSRFKPTDEPTTKYGLGVYCIEAKERAVVLLSWKQKKEWDEENKKRPFRSHLVRYSRTGSGKETTRYTVVSIGPIPAALVAEAKNAPPLPGGSVEAVCAEITRRATRPPTDAEREAAARDTNGKGTYSHPGNGGGTAPTAANPEAVKQLLAAEGALRGGFADVAVVSEKVKGVLMGALGKDKVVEIRNKVGAQAGQPLTKDQLLDAIACAVGMLDPKPVGSMAQGMGVKEDDIPF